MFYSHLGLFAVEPATGFFAKISWGGVGVGIFFVVSGFLISQSWENSSSVKSFAIKRALRILPALICYTLLAVFLLGPIFTTLPLNEYFANKATWTHLGNMLIFPVQYNLPGVFENNIYPVAVNGSLWTIRVETLMYCMVAFLGLVKLMSFKYLKSIYLYLFICVVAICFAFLSYNKTTDSRLYHIIFYFFYNALFFLIGMAFYHLRKKIPHSFALFLGICFFSLLLIYFDYPLLSYLVFIPYSVIYFAFIKCRLNNFGKYGDFSYGLYIYAFPIQQIFASYLPTSNLFLYSVSCFICILIFAVFSWYLVEKPALGLKYKFALSKNT